jgi:glycosyltransferase involved in cell wall biosynthesis
VKNGADYLAEAIESVLAQSEVELSVHVVDNLSADDSVEIARRYASDPRLRVDVNERDVKYYGSLNRALSEADTDYFVPFAADDVMRPGNLARKLEALEATGAGFAHSTAAKIDGRGAVDGMLFDHSQDPPLVEAPEFFRRIVPHNSVSCQAVVARTDALKEIGGFDARSLFAGDWLTWMRLSLRHAVATLPEPLMANRVHAAAGTGASMASGFNGRDIPATLDRVFVDDRLPASWSALRVPVLEEALREVAVNLDRDGVRRVAHGWAGYMAMGRRLALVPGSPVAFEQYRQLVAAAGLVPPAQPLVAAAVAPGSAEDAAALGAVVDELGGLLAGLNIAVDPERVDQTMELLGPVFGDTELDVALVPTGDPLEVITPGRVALARWGSELVAEAEGLGVPVYPFAIPDPFAQRPDPELWEAVDPDACLP